MTDPWSIIDRFVQMQSAATARDQNTADTALMQMFQSNIARGNAATQQGYAMDTLGKRNEYSTIADTTAYDRQLARDDIAYQRQDQRDLRSRDWAVSDAATADTRIRERTREEQQMLAEREAFGRMPVGQRRMGNGAPAPASGPNLTQQTIRGHEGFRAQPYWDVNAYRIGFGSDTVTTADGRVVRVKPGMTVTEDDAWRDLGRRTKEFERVAAGQVGGDTWNSLPENVRAGLTSVTYNYGSLPGSVVQAVRSGDVGAIARSVAGLAGHNNGINKGRRIKESQLIAGGGQSQSAAAPSGNGGTGTDMGVSDTILRNPVENMTSDIMTQEDAGTYVSDGMKSYLDQNNMDAVNRFTLTEAQLSALPDDLRKTIYPDPFGPPRNDGKAEYVQVQPRTAPVGGEAAVANAPAAKQTTATPVEIKTAPPVRYKDGRMIIGEDEVEIK